jgi:formylmethanofuran:tetrahydromethanopterin formyltransferase
MLALKERVVEATTGEATSPILRSDVPYSPLPPKVVSVAEVAIRSLKTDEEAVQAVMAAIPYARTKVGSIKYYRSLMRGAGEAVPTSDEIKRMRRAAEMNLAC